MVGQALSRESPSPGPQGLAVEVTHPIDQQTEPRQ